LPVKIFTQLSTSSENVCNHLSCDTIMHLDIFWEDSWNRHLPIYLLCSQTQSRNWSRTRLLQQWSEKAERWRQFLFSFNALLQK